jgi:hypothetical protein
MKIKVRKFIHVEQNAHFRSLEITTIYYDI